MAKRYRWLLTIAALPAVAADVVLYTNTGNSACAIQIAEGQTVSHFNGPLAIAVPFTTPAQTLGTVRARVFLTTGPGGDSLPYDGFNTRIEFAIASDENGKPGATLTGTAGWIPAGHGWNGESTLTLQAGGLAPKTKYWLVVGLLSPDQDDSFDAFTWRSNVTGAQTEFYGLALGGQMWYPIPGLTPAVEIIGTEPRQVFLFPR